MWFWGEVQSHFKSKDDFRRLSHVLMYDCLSDLKVQINFYTSNVQNLQCVEIFHTPGARLGYKLMCDCCFTPRVTQPKKINKALSFFGQVHSQGD